MPLNPPEEGYIKATYRLMCQGPRQKQNNVELQELGGIMELQEGHISGAGLEPLGREDVRNSTWK